MPLAHLARWPCFRRNLKSADHRARELKKYRIELLTERAIATNESHALIRQSRAPAFHPATSAVHEWTTQSSVGIVEIRERVPIRASNLRRRRANRPCRLYGAEQLDAAIAERESSSSVEPDLVSHSQPMCSSMHVGALSCLSSRGQWPGAPVLEPAGRRARRIPRLVCGAVLLREG
jgi:hypothetical protein